MELLIKPRGKRQGDQITFRHAGELPSRFDNFDPRAPAFDADPVIIDLREIEFVRPQAALWCLVYLSLAVRRGASCQLLVPQNMNACIHLKALGLFDALKSTGAEVDDRGVPAHEGDKTILSITSFRTESDVSDITNRSYERLREMDLLGPGLAPTISESFSELAMNAAQHSESEIGAFACVQLYEFERGPQFTCAVADGGIGVLRSLQRNPNLPRRVHYDWDALELAVRERVSGKRDPNRGIGLYGVCEDLRQPGRSLLLHSGLGSIEITAEQDIFRLETRRTRLFPGTFAFLSIPA